MSEQSAQPAGSINWTERLSALQAAIEAKTPGRPEARGYKIYSQSDEDGIIAEIFARIGVTNRIFVEFGAELGLVNNCRLLLQQGWSGLWMEGHPAYADGLRGIYASQIASGQLSFVSAYVNVDTINPIILGAGISGEIDLLSIDIDSNDYHVWNAIDCINPRALVVEHNGYPPPVDWVMPYTPDFVWDCQTGDIGSSIVANVRLATAKGYTLVAVGICSPNGFYVRNDLLKDRFPGPHDAESNFRLLDYDAIVNFPVNHRNALRADQIGWPLPPSTT